MFVLQERWTVKCTDPTWRTRSHDELWLSWMFETCSVVSSSSIRYVIVNIEIVISSRFVINFPITVPSSLLRDIFLYFLSMNLDFVLSNRLFFILRESLFFFINFSSVIFFLTVRTETLLFFGWTHFSYYFNLTNFFFNYFIKNLWFNFINEQLFNNQRIYLLLNLTLKKLFFTQFLSIKFYIALLNLMLNPKPIVGYLIIKDHATLKDKLPIY